MGFWGDVKDGISGVGHKLFGNGDPMPGEQERIDALREQASRAGLFANRGERAFGRLGNEAEARRRYLEELASGKNSISAMQLRQGLAQNQAAQRSVAASAAPNNAAMAARQAAMNMGRQGSAYAGQAAMAGLQERQNAEQALREMILQQRQQEMQAALGSRQNAMTGYGAGMPTEQRDKSFFEKFGGMISQGAAMAAGKPPA